MAMTLSNKSRSVSIIPTYSSRIPAPLYRISIVPNASTVSLTDCLIASTSRRSTLTKIASPPSAFMALTTSFPRSSDRPATETFAPSFHINVLLLHRVLMFHHISMRLYFLISSWLSPLPLFFCSHLIKNPVSTITIDIHMVFLFCRLIQMKGRIICISIIFIVLCVDSALLCPNVCVKL